MKHLFLIILLSLSFAFSTACSTRSSLEGFNIANQIPETAKFESVEVTDRTGYVFDEDEDKIVLAEEMQSELSSALATEGILGSEYTIKTEILEYAPGNALTRWLLPGAGATKLATVSYIYTPGGQK